MSVVDTVTSDGPVMTLSNAWPAWSLPGFEYRGCWSADPSEVKVAIEVAKRDYMALFYLSAPVERARFNEVQEELRRLYRVLGNYNGHEPGYRYVKCVSDDPITVQSALNVAQDDCVALKSRMRWPDEFTMGRYDYICNEIQRLLSPTSRARANGWDYCECEAGDPISIRTAMKLISDDLNSVLTGRGQQVEARCQELQEEYERLRVQLPEEAAAQNERRPK